MKRVLIFSLAYIPYVGGAELAIKEITDRIGPSEYSFDMITLRFDRNLPKVERVGNITIHRIGFTSDNPKISDRSMPFQCKVAKVLFPFTSFFKAQALHRENSYDIIWAMIANQAAFGALLFKFVNPKVPYFLELQDGNSLQQVKKRRPFIRLLWPLYRRLYLKADVIKTISHFIEYLAREVGYSGKLFVIPNGVDVVHFSSDIPADELAALKAKIGKKMGDVYLITVSRLVLSRGVEDIIRALPHLPANVKLLIAGDGEDKKKLELMAESSKVKDRVVFVGQVGHRDLPAYLKISDIFVRPSIIEGMGSAFIEAFAAGIPVVATPVGGIPDFLSDADRSPDMEPTGVFCNVRDPESVGSAVQRLMEDPVLTARIIKNAKELATQKYDWNLIAKDVREKIFDLLTQSV